MRASSLGGQRATKSIVNLWSSSAGAAPLQSLGAYFGTNNRAALSGAQTAATWKTVLTVSGSGGVCTSLAAWAADSTSRSIGMRITVDGVVVFTGTTAAFALTNAGLVAVAQADSYPAAGYYLAGAPPIVWNASLVVELQSSLTETDKLTLGYTLNTN